MLTGAQKILLRLDAYEVVGSRARVSSAPVEPVVIAGGDADFGTIGGVPSIAELQDLVALWAYRMKQLGDAYAKIAPDWVNLDSATFIAWTNDWTRLQDRYAAANGDAQRVITIAKTNPLPMSTLPAPNEYAALAKAMRQCYPPDGCPVSTGDWADLVQRLRAAGGVIIDQPPAPKAADVDLQVFASTASIDPIAQAAGLQAPTTGPLPVGWKGKSGFLDKARLLVMGAAVGGGAMLGLTLAGPIGALVVGGLAFGAVELLGRPSA